MTILSPAATYHAELREQLGSVGRALSFQRALYGSRAGWPPARSSSSAS